MKPIYIVRLHHWRLIHAGCGCCHAEIENAERRNFEQKRDYTASSYELHLNP